MIKSKVAGAIILETLRDRIISGLFLGLWQPGDRLPSIREVADAEQVDRKTAAAAYRRLEEEGLVEVRPRSGVYLRGATVVGPCGPIERLHRRWLSHTYHSARELGLNTDAILELVSAVKEIERLRIPVVECNWPQAEAIAGELRQRLDIHAVPYLLDDVRPGDPLIGEVPVVVTTPFHAAELRLMRESSATVAEVTTDPGLINDLRRHLTTAKVAVIGANRNVCQKIRSALRICGLLGAGDEHMVVAFDECDDLAATTRDVTHAFLWPGTPDTVEAELPQHVRRVRPRHGLADDSVGRVQAAVLDAAIQRIRGRAEPEPVHAT